MDPLNEHCLNGTATTASCHAHISYLAWTLHLTWTLQVSECLRGVSGGAAQWEVSPCVTNSVGSGTLLTACVSCVIHPTMRGQSWGCPSCLTNVGAAYPTAVSTCLDCRKAGGSNNG